MTEGEHERLVMLIEECSEVIKAATKMFRYGPDSYYPSDTVKFNNREELEEEILDLQSIIFRMNAIGDLSCLDFMSEDALRKVWKKKLRWTQYQVNGSSRENNI